MARDYDGRLWIVTTTFPSRAQALEAARLLVREELVACAQVGEGLVSIYSWAGALKEEAETALALKVASDRLEPCLARLTERHPYQTPQVLAWPAQRVGEAYGRWACGQEGP